MSSPQIQFKKAILAIERKYSHLHVEQGEKCAKGDENSEFLWVMSWRLRYSVVFKQALKWRVMD